MNQIAIRSRNLFFVLLGMMAFGVGLSLFLQSLLTKTAFTAFVILPMGALSLVPMWIIIFKTAVREWLKSAAYIWCGLFTSIMIPPVFATLEPGFLSIVFAIAFLWATLNFFGSGSRLFFVRCDDEG